ncbi:hypothetical protein FHX37_3411 [Haloactinospora alba]|uniref:Uncharacterized protein n=1 Tax=Haloactinospora alba TaxID=405555 RepID=A0A543NNP0_9ACTN|nr:hypothetical protein FHX37_3411 [Haloactinospora alba]
MCPYAAAGTGITLNGMTQLLASEQSQKEAYRVESTPGWGWICLHRVVASVHMLRKQMS